MANQDLQERIKEVLDQLRPYLQADGGDMKLVEITDDYVVKLELMGACSSCPMRTMTLKAGIEGTLKREIPEVKSVEAV